MKVSPQVHPTAIISSGAIIDPTTKIGPYCVIGPEVEIGPHCVIESHVTLNGRTTIGEGCHLFPGVAIGGIPQDKKFQGEKSQILMGHHNIIREYCTINLSSGVDTATRLGSHNLLMAYVHIAHNCNLGDHTVLANGATLAGHVEIGDHVVVGGLVGLHQFVRVGSYSIIGGMSKVIQDIPPYLRADGNPCRLVGLNSVGLTRNQFSPASREILKKAYRILFRSKLTTSDALRKIKEEGLSSPEIDHLCQFFQSSHRGVSKKTRLIAGD